jgi:hypothetical protein
MNRQGYNAVTLVDPENPLRPELLQHAGVGYVFASAPRLADGEDGFPVIAEPQRAVWEEMLRLYEGTDVRVLLMKGFYIDPAEEHQAVDFFGRRHPMACFRNTDFLDAMREQIVTLAQAFSAYPAFGGFVLDDGPHVRVDCCYCDLCLALFDARSGVPPPAFEPRDGPRIVDADDPILLWEEFQQESWQTYLRAQSQAVRSVSEDLLMLTIPSDSHFYGRFLNVQMDRDEAPLGHGAFLQRIERIQPQRWTIWQSFPLARLPEDGEEGLQPWAVGTHITANSPKMLLQTEGPYVASYTRLHYMSPAEIERMARVTLTEGADGICYWTPGQPLPSYPDALDAMAEIYRDLQQLGDVLTRRRLPKCQIGLLYSTTTEVMEQPWMRRTSERWRHLHAFEGIAYSLTRSNVPFQIMLESDLTPETLADFDALLLPAVGYLSQPAASIIEEEISEKGLRALALGPCVRLRGMISTECNPLIWHNSVSRGYRQQEHADGQWQEARDILPDRLRGLMSAPVRVYSDRVISRLYHLDDGELLLMVASWDLRDTCEVAIEGEGRATDLLSGRDLGTVDSLGRLTVQPAGWRILKIST